MARRNRGTLKRFFRDGALPTADHFGDLIDSNLNMEDEGFSKSPQHGFEISTIGGEKALISFFRGDHRLHPAWSMARGVERESLVFNRCSVLGVGEPQPILVLEPKGEDDTAEADVAWDVDVAGVLRMQGRMGAGDTVAADGLWHDITPDLVGCHGFEVMAGAGREGTGQYALMHAIALNTFNPNRPWWNLLNWNVFNRKNRVRYTHAYYQSFRNKLGLRWSGEDDGYRLQLRSRCDYGGGARIRYYVTRLWFDERMKGSVPQAGEGGLGQDEAT
jgi:hypothetical protein